VALVPDRKDSRSDQKKGVGGGKDSWNFVKKKPYVSYEPENPSEKGSRAGKGIWSQTKVGKLSGRNLGPPEPLGQPAGGMLGAKGGEKVMQTKTESSRSIQQGDALGMNEERS